MIEINEMKKDYGDFHLNITLSVPKGRVTGLVGRNGAGKSTTIKAILGLVSPDSGSVKVLGRDAHRLTAKDKERLGVALAEAGFSNYIDVSAAARILKQLYPRFSEPYFMKLVKEQGLPLNKPIKTFSTGMKAKLRVLTALSHQAELLIMDEPTAGLDVVARNEILDVLRSYMEQNTERAMLITSHISTDLEGLCDDIYLLHEGRVILHEDTDVLLGNYAQLKVTERVYETMDKTGIVSVNRTDYGYLCLTKEKQFYLDNYPNIVIEKGSIDDLIVMMTTQKGRKIV